MIGFETEEELTSEGLPCGSAEGIAVGIADPPDTFQRAADVAFSTIVVLGGLFLAYKCVGMVKGYVDSITS